MAGLLPVTVVAAPRSRRSRALRSKGWTPALVAVLAATLATGGAAPAVEPPPERDPVAALTPASGVLFGAYVDETGQTAPDEAVSRFEEAVGRKLEVHRIFRLWDEDLSASVGASVRRGRTPAVSISPRRVDGSAVGWSAIASGAHDARIAAQAAAVAAIGAPMFLTFHHEPDLAVGFGTADEYRAAWRHYVEVFRERGVTNVVWTWIVTPRAFGTGSGPTADALYPGDDVVDRVGLDVYNWFGCSPGASAGWSSVATQATPFRRFGQAHGKPLVIAEWGSVEDPVDPSRKAAWLTDAMATWTAWPEVTAVLYFHEHGSCRWYVDSSPAALAAFTAIGTHPAARTRASAWLRASATHGTAPLAVTLDASRSSGAGRGAGEGVGSWSLDLGDGSALLTGTGSPPAQATHTYAAGTHDVRLSVTDLAGSTVTDTVSVTAAPVPTVTTDARDVTTTSMTFQAVADLHGYAGTVRFEWGTTTAYGNWSPVYAVPRAPGATAVRHTATGLRPGTAYHLRTTATSPAGRTVVTSTVETAGKPTSSRQYTAGSTRTSTTFRAQVHPHRLPTTAWLEWGTTTALGTASPVTSLPALAYEKTVSSELVTGLTPGATYYYRVVARNSSGSFVGPVLSMRTPTTGPS